MLLLLLCSVIIILWYIRFRYKRQRLYQLAEKIPEFKDHAIPVLGYLGYSFDIENLIMPFIENNSKFSFQHGGCVKMWVGPLLLIGLTKLEDVEHVLKNCLEKDLFIASHLKTVTGDGGIFAPETFDVVLKKNTVSIWTRRRKVLVPAFSPKILNSFMDVLLERGTELVDSLEQFVDNEKFDVWPFVNKYTLVSVAETSLGVKINDMERESDTNILDTFHKLFNLVTYRLLHVWLWPDLAYNLTIQSISFRKQRKVLMNLINKIISSKRKILENVEMNIYENQTVFGQGDDKVKSFLDHLILLSKQQNGFTDTELKEEITTFLLAGTDTSAVAISNTLLLLSKYPKIQEKVYEELISVLGDSDTVLNKDHLNKMSYLDIVLKESLRLLPPVPLILRKPSEETELTSGVIIPENICVIISIWGVNRDPNYWGPDSECFKPERFLPGGKTGVSIPFSSGPRNCVGYRYAMISIKIALASILRRFKVVGEEEPTSKPNIKCNFSIMMKVADGYNIQLKRRCSRLP